VSCGRPQQHSIRRLIRVDEDAINTKAFASLVRPQGEQESQMRYEAELARVMAELRKRGGLGCELAHLAFGKGEKMFWCYAPGLLEDGE